MSLASQVDGKIRVERTDTSRLRVEVDSPDSNFHVGLLVRDRGKFASLKKTLNKLRSLGKALHAHRGLMLKQRVGPAFNNGLLSVTWWYFFRRI